jgi:hypothetical protein
MPAPEPKRCLACGYILDHLPEPRCPECGRPFDPGDPTTFARGAPRGWLSSVAHALLAALLIVVSGVAGLCVGAYLWHKQGHYYLSGADQALAATCIAVAGFVVCGSRRWRGRELLAALLIVGLLAYGILCRWIRPWITIQVAGWGDYFRVGWWRSDVIWLFWVGKFTVLPLFVPLICRAIGLLPLRRGRRTPTTHDRGP